MITTQITPMQYKPPFVCAIVCRILFNPPMEFVWMIGAEPGLLSKRLKNGASIAMETTENKVDKSVYIIYTVNLPFGICM